MDNNSSSSLYLIYENYIINSKGNDVIKNILLKTLYVVLGPNYLNDVKYFTNNITVENFKENPFICFNVSEYVMWNVNGRKLEKFVPNDRCMGGKWTQLLDIILNTDGIYKLYMINAVEHHEFVLFVLGDDIFIITGYGGYEDGPLVKQENKYIWRERIFKLKPGDVKEYSDIFGLPYSISQKVYEDYPNEPQILENTLCISKEYI